MNDRPTGVELLRAVERFLEQEVVPAPRRPAPLPRARGRERGRDRRARDRDGGGAARSRNGSASARCSACASERPAARDALRDAVRERTQALAERIRRGDADRGAWRDELIAHLRRTVADKLAVSQPPRV